MPFILLRNALLFSCCATYISHDLDRERARQVERFCVRRDFALSPETEQKIMALDPERVTEADIRGVLSQVPAPRIINIHGGVYPARRRMIAFSEFLMGMGCPGASIANPGDGTCTSCYESSDKIAGVIAWYYERDRLRPMMVGHSQGGFQTVKVLWKLAGLSAKQLHVWSPLTLKKEQSCDIQDPLTGRRRPVVGLQLPYVTSMGAGGQGRLPGTTILLAPVPSLLRALGTTMVVAGYAGTLWCHVAMGNAWRMGVNRTERTDLVTRGPYRFVRHPIYFFQGIIVAAISFLLPSILALAVFAIHVLCVLVRAADEESHLRTVLGQTDVAYCAQTGRWLPRLRHPETQEPLLPKVARDSLKPSPHPLK